ncbi:MAG: hypothetical protein IKU84_01470 [Clostridia bacterium]|nr:hypothetical protein [Clostridia bacterium]
MYNNIRIYYEVIFLRNFIKTYEVGAGEGDRFDLCKTSALLNFMQDAATRHSEIMGISRDVLITKYRTIWILARCLIKLNRPIRTYENLQIETWHRGFQGPLWYRDFEFKIDGETVGYATNVWVTADAVTHKMKRPEGFEEINTLSAAPDRSLGITLGKIKTPDDLNTVCERIVRFSDLDVNQHLNNAKYGDLVCDAVLFSAEKPCYFSSLQINYNNESLIGEKILLKVNDSHTFVTGVADSGDCKFTAEFTLNFS